MGAGWQRDQTALALVYDIYGRRIYSLIFCMVKNTGIAEDLVQRNVFPAVVESWKL